MSRTSDMVLVAATAVVVAGILLVLAQAITSGVHDLGHNLPAIVDRARHSDLGKLINGGSGSLDALRTHASDITKGVGKVSGGLAHVGASALGAVLYRDDRERYLRLTGQIVQATSRYMLGNLAISVICGTVYGVTAAILGLPYPLALALIGGLLDLVPNIGATIAGIIIGIVALSVSLHALIVFAIVMVVYQQVENYILQPTIIGKAAQVSGFTVLVSVLAFGSLFGLIGAIISVPLAAGIQLVVGELTAARRARIVATDAAAGQDP